MKSIAIISILLVFAATISPADKIWPKPRHLSHDPQGLRVKVSPCQINYAINAPSQSQIKQIIEWYLIEVHNCKIIGSNGQVTLTINVQDTSLLISTDVSQEAYVLSLPNGREWVLNADYYSGFLRGFQTLSQLFESGDNGFQISELPILINDSPSFKWRGLMIDTSRHYLPVVTIKRAIDSMLYSKLNVLHWHIIDEDAFPMEIPNIPELSQFGSVGGIFSPEDIRQIIDYARLRGIRVVPEIDSPAHTQSWGRSEKLKEITLNCNGIYMGQFDPTLNQTWQVVTEVMKYINSTFDDEYVHFGGDEVMYECWGQRQSILDWMAAHNIPDYEALSIYYREQQKSVWREISAKKKVIYWANEDIDLPLQQDDVIDWWGVSANVNRMVGRKNQVILSNYDLTYLDIGFNNFYGNVYGVYQDWRKMYNYQPRVQSVNVIGGETCMWNELGNLHTFDQKVVQRSSVIAERLWNVQIDIKEELKNIATRLTAQTERLRERGFKVWPVTVQLCQKDMSICF